MKTEPSEAREIESEGQYHNFTVIATSPPRTPSCTPPSALTSITSLSCMRAGEEEEGEEPTGEAAARQRHRQQRSLLGIISHRSLKRTPEPSATARLDEGGVCHVTPLNHSFRVSSVCGAEEKQERATAEEEVGVEQRRPASHDYTPTQQHDNTTTCALSREQSENWRDLVVKVYDVKTDLQLEPEQRGSGLVPLSAEFFIWIQRHRPRTRFFRGQN
ncbi:unnamed protein product [Pleuronectes platessa]|uniref:Uncharacterized protein n=1 Tax=Pleuronectes platessa TaxID=8262 RepID=A0A9N7UEX9_PLEPL|nr:unnamed protein product [Pleuronectes platessa]